MKKINFLSLFKFKFSFRSTFSKTNKENGKPSEAFAKEKIVPLTVEPEDDRGRKRTKVNEGNLLIN